MYFRTENPGTIVHSDGTVYYSTCTKCRTWVRRLGDDGPEPCNHRTGVVGEVIEDWEIEPLSERPVGLEGLS